MQAVVDTLGNCLNLLLTQAKRPTAPGYRSCWRPCPSKPGAVVADKAYDTNPILDTLTQQQAEAVNLPKSTCLDQCDYNENLYADRNIVERSFAVSKRHVALPPLQENHHIFLAVAHLPAVLDWMR